MLIELKGITKTYLLGENEVRALRGVDLEIDAGEYVAIMGPSGSGKSTLTQIIGLLDVPTSGSYRLGGHEVAKLDEDQLAVLRREEIGFVFQQFNLLPRLSAEENTALPLFYSRGRPDAANARDLLNQVGLRDRGGHRPNQMSGGQQQRVAIARALVNAPKIILADEPTGNLDSESQHEIMEILDGLNRRGATIVLVTHEEEVAAHARRVVRIRDGRVQSDEIQRPAPTPITPRSAKPQPRQSSQKDGWQRVRQHFAQGLRTLSTNKVRTFLSVLGILIGVASVVAMLALGRGAQRAIEEQLKSLGSNLLVLRPGNIRMGGVSMDSGAAIRISNEDVAGLLESVSGIKEAAPMVNGRGLLAYQNRNSNTQIIGASPSYPRMHAALPAIGRFFTAEENRSRALVAVLGYAVAQDLFGSRNPIGELVKINKINFLVIGVFPEKGGSAFRNQDDQVAIPVQTAMHRLFGKEHLDSVELEISDLSVSDAIQADIREFLFRRKNIPLSQREDAFQIWNMADIQSAVSSSSQTLSALLASIAAISLVVGGIGIMNIMLVSVTERTREIGLRKAIGATRGDIMAQFLVEAIVVSLAGGLAGIAVGAAITMTISKLAGWATSITPSSIVLSFGFSAAVGVVFGLYPARKAALLQPIQALRSE